MKQTHDLVQGSEAWHQFRFEHHGASEAAAMLGISKLTRRSELLHMKHTGTAKEFSDWVQEHILDHGHAVEALARPIVEETIGEDLYPVTLSHGPLSASCDGLTMDDRIAFEHKQYSASLFALVGGGVVPEEHMPQCQQILMISGAEELLFVCSDGTRERMAIASVKPDPAWFERLRAGWAQFDKDLAAYEPPAVVEKVVAAPILGLPALSVRIRGEVVASNLAAYRTAADQYIDGIKTDLNTDQDFADAANVVKFLDEAAKTLEAVKKQALGETADIDELMRTIDHITERMDTTRIDLDKKVTKRKGEIKAEEITKARKAYGDHITELTAKCEGLWVPLPPVDFDGAAKNKRTLETLRDAVNTALANGKIAADARAALIQANLALFKADDVTPYGFLFADRAQLIGKPTEDLKVLVQARIDAHKKAEDKKAKATSAAPAPVTLEQVAAAVLPAPVATAIVAASPSPAIVALHQAAVLENQDVIAEFVASRRDWSVPERHRARAILVEYEKFRADHQQAVAA